MRIPIIKQFFDDEQLYDIAIYVLEILPERKEIAIMCENRKAADSFAQSLVYTDKSNRIATIKTYDYKVVVTYSDPTRLPFGATVESICKEYSETFGW